jgi:lysophospholipase L1-like esterase
MLTRSFPAVRRLAVATLSAVTLSLPLCMPMQTAHAQPAPGTQMRPPANQPAAAASETATIRWSVRNRFRLFRNEQDFAQQVAAMHENGAALGVLAAERKLERSTDGRGWARQAVTRLCLDGTGKLLDTCERDGEKESYLAPTDYAVRVTLDGVPLPGATCAWTFTDNELPAQELTIDCAEEVTMRVPAGRATRVKLDVIPREGPVRHAETEIAVRDLLIAGLGDSIAAGEGNPDRPVALGDDGFCFRRFLGTSTSQYYRPGRAGYHGDKSCAAGPGGTASPADTQDWRNRGARWMNAACHASLYGYQMRAALALAVENPHVAVTFLPLACSGATIADGLFDKQTARECPLSGRCAGSVPGQLTQLRDLLKRAGRGLDLMLLTIGANDVEFSGMVGDVIVDATTERTLSRRGGLIVSASEADDLLKTKLPGAFRKLRAALKPLVGGDLRRVVYTTYGHPALQAPGVTCPGGRDGFDVHPALDAGAERLHAVSDFVSARFLPTIRSLATCGAGTICETPATERMTFVDAHQAAFAEHGFCARADSDPAFDRNCFSPAGESFEQDQAAAADGPLACDMRPGEYRPYASRARWVRTANDSYFTAMTYPEGLPALLQPRDIHDAMWGIVSAVYGGAIHPTAEGHAAMADAVLPAARALLDLDTPPEVTAAPLAPPVPDATVPPTSPSGNRYQ